MVKLKQNWKYVRWFLHLSRRIKEKTLDFSCLVAWNGLFEIPFSEKYDFFVMKAVK